MQIETGERISNPNYTDIIVEYNGDYSVFDQFPDATVAILNSIYAVVYIPAELLTMDFVSKWGYSILPNCYGFISDVNQESTGIPQIRGVPNFNLRGQGVLIGIVDSGIDYTNPIFQNADGTTRIISIWDQTISGSPPANFNFGTEYSKDVINAALKLENPLELVPSMDEFGHGTMVAGIAAGNEDQPNNFFGIATESELIVVKLKQANQALRNFFVIPDDAACYSGIDIFFGINYLLQISNYLQRPLVICIALGSSQGGHDGRGVLNNALSLIGTRPGVAVVVAAGNEGNAKRHYFGSVNPTIGKDTVELLVGENEKGFVMELWGKTPSIYSIDIISPSGEYIPRLLSSINESMELSFIFEKTVINLLYELIETQSGDQLILLRFTNPTPGIWRFNVYNRSDINQGFHIWLPMDKFISDSTYFIKPDIYTTILSIGNAIVPITVTAYNSSNESLYLNASRGYTRLEGIKPEIAAPGVDITGPNLQKGFTSYTGTSPAVAHTAGVVAMLLEWGYVKGNIPDMNTIDIKILIIKGARRKEDIEYPNRDWGYGILDIYRVFYSLRTNIPQK